jgi:hypothetical protein
MFDFFSGSYPDTSSVQVVFNLRILNLIISLILWAAMSAGNYMVWIDMRKKRSGWTYEQWYRRVLRLRLRWALSFMVFVASLRTAYMLHALWHIQGSQARIPSWAIVVDAATFIALVATIVTIYMYAQVTDAG